MRLSLPWCGPLERCLTQVTTEGNAKRWEAQDKDHGSFGIEFSTECQILDVKVVRQVRECMYVLVAYHFSQNLVQKGVASADDCYRQR